MARCAEAMEARMRSDDDRLDYVRGGGVRLSLSAGKCSKGRLAAREVHRSYVECVIEVFPKGRREYRR